MTTAALAPPSFDVPRASEEAPSLFGIECAEEEAAQSAAESAADSLARALEGIWDLEETLDRMISAFFAARIERTGPNLLTGALHIVRLLFGAEPS